jgi:predicted nucleic acid-binding protein
MPAHVLDSSAWIECLDDGPNTRHFAPILKKLPDIIVPSIVITEVRKVILAQRSANDAQTVTDAMIAAIVVDIDPMIATQAADLFIKYKLPIADSLIYAVTLRHNATLWTQDAHFQGLPHVKFFAKSKK